MYGKLGIAGFSAFAVIGLAACSDLPSAGPTTAQILEQASTERQHFELVEVDDHVIKAIGEQPAESLRIRFEKFGQKPPVSTIGVGDSLSVIIWEASGGGVFGGAGSETTASAVLPVETAESARSVAIPDQIVAADGAISVPYAGRIPAAGRTPFEVQKTIERRLADRAVEPQAIVTLTKSVSNAVTLSGDVVNGARVPLSVRGDRILDVAAATGGVKAPPYETLVRLTRDGVTATIPMDKLMTDPGENIYAWPGDVITLVRAQRTFLTFGASLNNAQIPFNADKISLAQAIAKAGGLIDLRADSAGVFLFRFEARAVVRALGAQVIETAPDGTSPILYHLDLHDSAGYFLAKRFRVEDGDIVYVANASLAELQKFFTLVGTVTGPVISGVVVTRSTNGGL